MGGSKETRLDLGNCSRVPFLDWAGLAKAQVDAPREYTMSRFLPFLYRFSGTLAIPHMAHD